MKHLKYLTIVITVFVFYLNTYYILIRTWESVEYQSDGSLSSSIHYDYVLVGEFGYYIYLPANILDAYVIRRDLWAGNG